MNVVEIRPNQQLSLYGLAVSSPIIIRLPPCAPDPMPGFRRFAAEQLPVILGKTPQLPETVLRGNLGDGEPVTEPDNGRTHLMQPHGAQKSLEPDAELLLERQLEGPHAGIQGIADAGEREHLVRL